MDEEELKAVRERREGRERVRWALRQNEDLGEESRERLLATLAATSAWSLAHTPDDGVPRGDASVVTYPGALFDALTEDEDMVVAMTAAVTAFIPTGAMREWKNTWEELLDRLDINRLRKGVTLSARQTRLLLYSVSLLDVKARAWKNACIVVAECLIVNPAAKDPVPDVKGDPAAPSRLWSAGRHSPPAPLRSTVSPWMNKDEVATVYTLASPTQSRATAARMILVEHLGSLAGGRRTHDALEACPDDAVIDLLAVVQTEVLGHPATFLGLWPDGQGLRAVVDHPAPPGGPSPRLAEELRRLAQRCRPHLPPEAHATLLNMASGTVLSSSPDS